MKHVAFEAEGLNGPALAWGVKSGSALVYEEMFRKVTAERLAQLCDAMPDQGWDAHSAVLEDEGYALDDPAVLTHND